MKIKIALILLIFIIISIPNTYATNEIISSQMDSLNISSFIKEGEKYSKEVFPEIDINELLNSAISGRIENSNIYKGILHILGNEFANTITLLGSVLVVIVVHSILKSISDNLSNEKFTNISYYIQYILIVTLVMSNFSGIINMIKDTIESLVGFMNSLIPILLALMITTGSIASASFLEPLILFAVVFIGNIITLVVIPITLVATVLGIISNVSDKVQIGKLAKFFRSSIIWFLGTVIALFVGIVSLEGTLTSSVDGVTAKGIKTAVATFIPVVGKVLGDSVDSVLRMCIYIKKCSWVSWYDCISRNMCNTNYKVKFTYNYISIYSSNL